MFKEKEECRNVPSPWRISTVRDAVKSSKWMRQYLRNASPDHYVIWDGCCALGEVCQDARTAMEKLQEFHEMYWDEVYLEQFMEP